VCKIAIVIPNHKQEITNEEKISLNNAKNKFLVYEKFLLIPNNLKMNFDTNGFKIKETNPVFFSTYINYNKFLLNSDFYKNFGEFDYVLIFQLDCLFFSNEKNLKYFSSFDFVGPPHINIKKKRFSGTLNGGFSFRKVSSCIKTLKSEKFNIFNFRYIQIRYFLNKNRFFHFLKFFTEVFILSIFTKIFKRKTYNFSNIFFKVFPKYYNEDIFWSIFSNLFDKNFKIASFKEALSFGFDKDPEQMFKLNNNKLPLGCHCWYKGENKNFWRNFFSEI
jgi:hypothetical protein